jgi:serine/threonine protein kinase
LRLSSFSTWLDGLGGTVRWMAPEILDGRAENNSAGRRAADMYAFGCVCYEVCKHLILRRLVHDFTCIQIFSGRVPLHEITNYYSTMTAVVHGIRPSRPAPDICARHGLDSKTWDIMQECWKAQPAKRPSASNVVSWLILL